MTFKAAIVGTSAVAHLHAQAVIADPRVDLVAVSYRSAARRDAFADQYDVAGRYATITELLAGEQLDVVILCTPPDLHLEQALTAYGAGVHVICEKPPALSLAELDEMQAAAAGLVLAVVFQPEVTCRVTSETPVEQGFHRFGGVLFWLLQGQWDRGADEFEGAAPGGGGYGEQVEAGLVVAGDA